MLEGLLLSAQDSALQAAKLKGLLVFFVGFMVDLQYSNRFVLQVEQFLFYQTAYSMFSQIDGAGIDL